MVSFFGYCSPCLDLQECYTYCNSIFLWLLPLAPHSAPLWQRLYLESCHTWSAGPCLPCVISLMSVFCVHLVIYQQLQQLGLTEARSWAAPRQLGQTVQVRHGRRYGPPIITVPLPLSSSWAGQGAVLGQFSTAFGLCAFTLNSILQPLTIMPKWEK